VPRVQECLCTLQVREAGLGDPRGTVGVQPAEPCFLDLHRAASITQWDLVQGSGR